MSYHVSSQQRTSGHKILNSCILSEACPRCGCSSWFFRLAADLEMDHLQDEMLICAVGRTPDEGQEACPIYPKTNFIPFCVYVQSPGNGTHLGSSYYGCVYGDQLPIECSQRKAFIADNVVVEFQLRMNNSRVKSTGAMMCCSRNYCYQLSDPIFTHIRLSDRAGKNEGQMQLPIILVVILMWVIILSPYPLWLLEQRHAADAEREEASEFHEPSISNEQMEFQFVDSPLREMQQEFASYKLMVQTVKRLRPPRSTSRTSMSESTALSSRRWGVELTPEMLGRTPSICRVVERFQTDKEQVTVIRRNYPTRLEKLAERMIEHGPHRFDFDAIELAMVFDSCVYLFKEESTMLQLEGDICVCGTLDGNYGDLFRWFNSNGWPPNKKYLFLGGLTRPDSEHSLETLVLICALKVMLPDHIYVLRGVSEVHPINLKDRMSFCVARAVAQVVERVYKYLPLAALVGHNILLCHGAPSANMRHLHEIQSIRRPLREFKMGTLEADLIFSKVGKRRGLLGGARGSLFRPSFQPDISTGLAPSHKVKMVVCSRNSCADGFVLHNSQLMTLWSSGGRTSDDKMADAACLHISHDLELKLARMSKFGTFSREQINVVKEKQTQQKKMEDRKRHGETKRKHKLEETKQGQGSTTGSSVVKKTEENPKK